MGLPKEAEDCTLALLEKERTPKDPSPDSWLPPPQSSQGSSQASPCQSQHSKKEEACLNSQEGRLCHEVQQIWQGRVPQKGEQEVQPGQVLQQRDAQKGKAWQQRQGRQGQI